MMLPIRPILHLGESSISLLARLAAVNGFGGPLDLAASLGLPWHSILTGRHVRAIARAAGCDVQDLSDGTGRSTPKHVELRGEILGRRHWSASMARCVCPACLREDRQSSGRIEPAWGRTWWDVRATTTCLRHRLPLVSSCVCGTALRHDDARIDTCSCGRLVESHADPFSIPDLQGDAYVLGRIRATDTIVNPILDGLPLGTAIKLMEDFGQALSPSSAIPRHRILTNGFSAFHGWPSGMNAALDQIAAGRLEEGRWGSANAYGNVLETVRDLPKVAAGHAVRLVIATHAMASGIARGAKPVLGVTPANDNRMTLAAARRVLTVGHNKAKVLLGTSPRAQRGNPAMLRTQVVARLRQRMDHQISLTELKDHLCIGKAQVRALVQCGIIKRDEHGKVASDTAVRLVDSLLATRVPIRATSLPLACRVARTSLLSACTAILYGYLDVDEIIGEKGLARVGVDVATLRTIGKRGRADGFTIEEAAAHLGEKWQVVRDIASFGLIIRDGSGKLDRSSVKNFSQHYVPAATIARRIGTSPKHLLRIAESIGVKPVIAPPAVRKAFYRREDAARLG